MSSSSLTTISIPAGTAVLSVAAAKKREGRSRTTTLSFTVTRSGVTTTAVNVDYATSDGTGILPSDYVAATGNLAFATNQTTGTIQVTVNGDGVLEHDETFFLTCSIHPLAQPSRPGRPPARS